MKVYKSVRKKLTAITKYRYKWVFFIAVTWTAVDFFLWQRYMRTSPGNKFDSTFQLLTPESIILRILIIFYMSVAMGHLLVFKLKKMFRNVPMFVNMILKTAILLLASIIMNFLLHISYSFVVLHLDFLQSFQNFYYDSSYTPWFWNNNLIWMTMFVMTQMLIDINEKYSPGIFMDIFVGRYMHPRIEKRIIMFLDLQDSTPIAEKLGHTLYFSFIRDFIYYVSTAVLEHRGVIYQYVGDEVVISWKYSESNVKKPVSALIDARKALQKHANDFKRRYGVVPEFKVGLHIGEVTIGEIGIIKRDLAMSGDTMNTAARIRTSCNELNHRYIVSKDFSEAAKLKPWQCKSLGSIDLKGRSNSIELFALII